MKHFMTVCSVVVPLLAWGNTTLSYAETNNWTSFRNGGHSTSSGNYPVKWSPKSGVAWQTETAGYGQSSPVIWQDNIYLTAVKGDQKDECLLICLDLLTGNEKWTYTHPTSAKADSNYRASRAAPTPLVDDRGVFAFYESGDLLSLTHAGKLNWSRSLTKEYGRFENHHGLGASPAQNETALFINIEHSGESYLLAVEKQTGENIWKIERPSGTSWTSPVLTKRENETQLIVSSGGAVTSYQAATGKQIWSLEGLSGNSVPSPLVLNHLVYVGARTSEFGKASSAAKSNLCLQIPTTSDDSPTITWRAQKAVSDYASPVACNGAVYFLNDGGVLYCLNQQTGKQNYVKRIGTSCWTTPIVVGDLVYFFGKDGQTAVIKGGADYEKLGMNQLWNPEEPPLPEEYREAVEKKKSKGERRSPGRFVSRLLKGDKNQDGKLSREELPPSMQGTFDTTDLDSNGYLNQSELQKMEEAFNKRRRNSRASSRDPIVYGVAAASERFIVRTGTRVFCISRETKP